MNWKKIVGALLALILVVTGVWTYMVTSYESDLGTDNIILVDASDIVTDLNTNNEMMHLSFDDGADDLLWSSMDIGLEIDGVSHTCSFGSQSTSSQVSEKIFTKLGADGQTFTVEIDASDEEEFTYLQVDKQLAGNSSDHWMRFSSTDIYLGEGIVWTFLEGTSFGDVVENPTSDLSNNTEDRLEWYTYDMSVHRVDPNDGIYIVAKDNKWFKIKFLSYYNSHDESRFPTMQIAALNGTTFSALSNPDLVVPSPCKIVTEDIEAVYWSKNETITLVENGIDLCDQNCTVIIHIEYETILVAVSESEITI